jgi:hypothetical protein
MNKKQLLSLIAPDGTKFGDKIPRSSYFRTFCGECGTPMRVSKNRLYVEIPGTDIKFKTFPQCEDCNPKHIGVGNGHTCQDEDAYRVSMQHER